MSPPLAQTPPPHREGHTFRARCVPPVRPTHQCCDFAGREPAHSRDWPRDSPTDPAPVPQLRMQPSRARNTGRCSASRSLCLREERQRFARSALPSDCFSQFDPGRDATGVEPDAVAKHRSRGAREPAAAAFTPRVNASRALASSGESPRRLASSAPTGTIAPR
jgi:hypothetical protein